MPNIRLTNLIIFFGCFGLILTGLYMQHRMGLEPCALCITQRVFIIATGVVALIAFLHHPRRTGLRIYATLGALTAIIGGSFSSRQIWLQSLPEDLAPACGPGIQYMLENFPFTQALELLLRGDGNCAEIVWTFLGFSIPVWTLVAFFGLLCLNIWQWLRANQRK